MGYSSYSSTAHRTRTLSYKSKSTKELFSENFNDAMNPKHITIRECRDSENHPEAFPIILGLDVTGSMGIVPDYLVREGLIHVMDDIIKGGLKSPQICFMGIGDHEYDKAPLQVGQFEASDDLLDKWLRQTFLEGGGGGNRGESYMLPWLFAAERCVTDHWEKRNKRGVIITIGDEPVLEDVDGDDLVRYLGGQYQRMTTRELLDMVREKWEVHHIHISETASGRRPFVANEWRSLLGHSNVHPVQSREHVSDMITKLVLDVKKNQSKGSSTSVPEQPVMDEASGDLNEIDGDSGKKDDEILM